MTIDEIRPGITSVSDGNVHLVAIRPVDHERTIWRMRRSLVSSFKVKPDVIEMKAEDIVKMDETNRGEQAFRRIRTAGERPGYRASLRDTKKPKRASWRPPAFDSFTSSGATA